MSLNLVCIPRWKPEASVDELKPPFTAFIPPTSTFATSPPTQLWLEGQGHIHEMKRPPASSPSSIR